MAIDPIPDEVRSVGGGAARPRRPRSRGASGESGRSSAGRGGWHPRATALVALGVAVAGCVGGAGEGGTPPPPPTLATVGDNLFHDPSLSASGQLACASCHAPDRAYTDPVGTFLPVGGVNLDQQGLRSSLSLRYIDTAGPFEILSSGTAPVIGKGGYFWDGRADSRVAQARGPLFSSIEMANPDVPTFVAGLRSRPYFADLVAAASLGPAASDEEVLDAALQALAAYQGDDPDFHPFSSKYDAFLDGKAALTEQEARGLQLFNDPQVGACASCHPSAPGPDGSKPHFTKFLYFALGVPRNSSRWNLDPTFFDLGLCGPRRTDLADRPELCGTFRTPTLRNVALTAPYFHNAAFTTLKDVVSFYATRDTDPGRWYPTVNCVVQKFDDLPAEYQGNVSMLPPFGRQVGDPPRLTPQDVDDIVAFLGTLTDGAAP